MSTAVPATLAAAPPIAERPTAPEERVSAGVARSASTGDTRPACHAGPSAATTVTSRPSSAATASAPASSGVPDTGASVIDPTSGTSATVIAAPPARPATIPPTASPSASTRTMACT